MRYILSMILLLFSVVGEVFFLPLPLTLIFFIFLVVWYKEAWVLFVGILIGTLLDSLLFRTVGVTSLFFVLTTGVIFLYSRKFEVKHFLFGTLFSLLCSGIYLIVFGSTHFFLQLFLSTIFAICLFAITSILLFNKEQRS